MFLQCQTAYKESSLTEVLNLCEDMKAPVQQMIFDIAFIMAMCVRISWRRNDSEMRVFSLLSDFFTFVFRIPLIQRI